jgi:hypothetical protein
MKKLFLHFILLSLSLTACAPAGTQTPTSIADVPTEIATELPTLLPTEAPVMNEISHPFPQHVKYAPSTILPTLHAQDEMDDHIRAFYEDWKSKYLVEAGTSADGNPMFRVAFGKDEPAHSTTVSEGQGYGMMIVPIMAGYDPEAQAIFDGLFTFVREHPSEGDARLMDWKVPDPQGNSSAFDGDADIA